MVNIIQPFSGQALLLRTDRILSVKLQRYEFFHFYRLTVVSEGSGLFSIRKKNSAYYKNIDDALEDYHRIESALYRST